MHTFKQYVEFFYILILQKSKFNEKPFSVLNSWSSEQPIF